MVAEIEQKKILNFLESGGRITLSRDQSPEHGAPETFLRTDPGISESLGFDFEYWGEEELSIYLQGIGYDTLYNLELISVRHELIAHLSIDYSTSNPYYSESEQLSQYLNKNEYEGIVDYIDNENLFVEFETDWFSNIPIVSRRDSYSTDSGISMTESQLNSLIDKCVTAICQQHCCHRMPKEFSIEAENYHIECIENSVNYSKEVKASIPFLELVKLTKEDE